MKKLITVLIVMLAFMVFFSGQSEGVRIHEERVTVGTGQFYSFASSSSGGTWFTMAGGAVALFNENLDGARFSVEATGGSVENVRRTARRESDFGLAYSSHIYEIVRGIGLYEGEQSYNLRVIAEVFESPHKFVTLQNSGILTLSDLEGQVVSLGAAGSGTSDNSRRTFATLGINVIPVEMSFADQARALQDGRIAAFGQGGAPAAGIVELLVSNELHFIPFSEEELEIMVTGAPYFEAGELPAYTYERQSYAIPTFTFKVYWVTHKDTPDEVVYQALRLAHSREGLEYLNTVHRQWATLTYASAEGLELMGTTVHPGALRYWEQYWNQRQQ